MQEKSRHQGNHRDDPGKQMISFTSTQPFSATRLDFGGNVLSTLRVYAACVAPPLP